MRKPPVTLHLRALESPSNGRSTRRPQRARTTIHRLNGRPSMRMRIAGALGFFRGVRRAIGEVMAMAVILALAIVLAHAMLIVLFPV